MPAQLLFDISGIDLASCAYSRQDIARYNPHRGVMALLDGVVWHDEQLSHGVGVKHVRPDEFWCAGHIPGQPLMPGVLMIETAAQLSSFLYFKRSGRTCFAGFTRIEDVAFRSQVVPGDTMYLLSAEVKYNPKRFVTRVQGVVGDQIVFEGQITGMAFPNMGDVRRDVEELEPSQIQRA